MINKLKIYKTASYLNMVEIEPSIVNYFYGSNGTGKTSLGSVINDSVLYPECELSWKTTEMETLVYNKKFVDLSFNQINGIEGIFTLGKDEMNVQRFIEDSKNEISNLSNSINGLKEAIEKQELKLGEKRKESIAKSWKVKVKYEKFFKPAYEKFMGSGEAFFNKCIEEIGNSSKLLNEDDIKAKCIKVFNDDIKAFDQIDLYDYSKLNSKENSRILSTKIIGKEDVEIGKLIKKLDNSDWVKGGTDYLEITQNECPFCQQEISTKLKTEIESFFDEAYDKNKEELNTFIHDYSIYITERIADAKTILNREIPILNFDD